MKQILIILVVALCIVLSVYFAENGVPSINRVFLVPFLLASLIPIIHALIRCPKYLPFYWIAINIFLGVLAYPFFLMSLKHARKNLIDDGTA
ncbi:hypothetical protein BCT27_24905 [Enterovibrio norvegicus]|nr:hypothetical protein BCT27_24905 [Enterovibrio norvegicus]